ncbi:MAG: transposase [Deltaproteobacteria bacterium]|nr:transposase [Deltaproteobacteria bacterium]MBN2672559.1 transposase [Deltaproteobacteria bacterium]
MARTVRKDYSGAWHHVMNRGRNHENIFVDDNDMVEFLFTIENTIDRYDIEVHAFSLMPNHFHLLVRSRHGNLSQAMKHLGSVYTLSYNRRHNKDGTLFRGRFKNQVVKDDAYLMYLFAYIHLNPVRAGLVSRVDALLSRTSYRRLLGKDSEPKWLSTTGMQQVFGSADEMKELTMRLHRKSEPWPEGMRRDDGWFLWNLCSAPGKPVDIAPTGGHVELSKLLNELCDITGAPKSRLTASVMGPGGNPERRFACWALFHGTLMTQAEIAKALKQTKAQVAQNIQRCKTGNEQLSAWKTQWKKRYPEKVSTVNT